jgi:hypothetical protein
MKELSEYITEYVSSGRGRKISVSPKISDLKIGDMVRIKSKEDILDMVTIHDDEMRYYYDNGSYLYIADKMLEMCGDVCKVVSTSLSAVKLYDKKFPSMQCWWPLELLEEI